MGGNPWLVLESAAGLVTPLGGTQYLQGQSLIDYLFSTANAANNTVIRFITSSATPGFALETGPSERCDVVDMCACTCVFSLICL